MLKALEIYDLETSEKLIFQNALLHLVTLFLLTDSDSNILKKLIILVISCVLLIVSKNKTKNKLMRQKFNTIVGY
ncbi:hypothetical protein BpHYR1_001701 [Brachionus plicatilis]|uniref:Uncharacterized protein n=1 Tax=Brachionus plicatilis TaxID=10195 RepID=A0A3M7T010_BRAPC|nr:hypothetical protein BpHYR1_001701 [Brachionus plicatilis]